MTKQSLWLELGPPYQRSSVSQQYVVTLMILLELIILQLTVLWKATGLKVLSDGNQEQVILTDGLF
jgi:hypothetical protein